MAAQPIKVLFICTGNICRSPMAEAIFRHMVIQEGLLDYFEIASAGTGGWHVGDLPHSGTREVLRTAGIAHDTIRARQIDRHDLLRYDYLVAMDRSHLRDIQYLNMTPTGEVVRLLDFAPPGGPEDVPDPYYDGRFQEVYDLVTAGCAGLLAHIRERHGF